MYASTTQTLNTIIVFVQDTQKQRLKKNFAADCVDEGGPRPRGLEAGVCVCGWEKSVTSSTNVTKSCFYYVCFLFFIVKKKPKGDIVRFPFHRA